MSMGEEEERQAQYPCGVFVLFFYPCVLIWDFRGDDKLKPGRVETRERENWIRLRAPPARKKM